MSCSRTVLCSDVRVPSFASLSPQPWVLGAGQGLPAVSFLPFLGRKPGRWGTPGWSLRRGGGLSHHPAPQSDSALCPHPSLGSLRHSGRWINGVAAWAVWRAQATPAGLSPLAASVPPLMARSGSATPPSPAPGAPPRSPSRRLVQDVNGPLRELRPRLCHLQKGPQGYGFNLHSDKSRPGQYIRSVDPGSPAAHSGLRAQDRLIEVNGQNVEGLRHAEVVASIKAREDEAWLLVVDPETDEHFKRLRVTPTEEHVEGPLPSPVTNGTSSAQDGSTWKRDPFQESGLHLSPTAAEAKEKVRATRVNKRAPQMDWNRKREIFSNF
ncbi:Na(+)/H(+) exchange regulatory cofactor NHE-RF2 isoform X4 [Kogia breviceps]|uniref:Na(+)/H(+) exchange regulatory cofactor NHE-RF2 isoform X4 n=1 Tax=Kogia breviceps TaxID=27615 RepID=UPI0034D1F13D